MQLYSAWVLIGVAGLCVGQDYIGEFADNQRTCRTMMPDLNSQPQQIEAPFKVELSKKICKPQDVIRVTLTAIGRYKFRGFLIQARLADWRLEDSQRRQPLGFLTKRDGTLVTCLGADGNALTHAPGSPGSEDAKSSLTLEYRCPRQKRGHVQFFVTYVVDPYTYWVAEPSDVISDPRASPMPVTSTAPPMIPVRTITVHDCGIEKGCYRNPPDCLEPECQAIVTWKNHEEYVEFEMSADSNGWVAVGFSEDQKMGKDSVTECVWNEQESRVVVQQSYNEKDGKNNVLIDTDSNLDQTKVGLLNSEGYFSKGRVRCFFYRAKRVPGWITVFDLNPSYYLLLAWGNSTVDGHKMLHPLEPFKHPFVSTEKVSMSEYPSITHTARYPLVKAHAIFMLIGWMMCASTAILIARYYKKQWSEEDTICGEQRWFAVHRGLQLCNLLFTIIAFILIFVHAGGYSQMPHLPAKAHPIMGIITTILCVINPLIAMCRCKDKHKYRPVFNWIHWAIGSIAEILAAVNILIGLSIYKVHVRAWVTWVVVIYLLFHLIIELLLEIHGCRNGHRQKERDQNGFRYIGKRPKPVGYHFKRNVLWVYLVVMIILGILMVIGVASG